MSRPSKPPKKKLAKKDVDELDALLQQKGLDKSKHGDPLLSAEDKHREDVIGDLKTWILSLSKAIP